jgi:hypothetical protein
MVVMLIAGCVTPCTVRAQVTADDFLPVVQGGAAEVKQPDKVAVNGKIVTAATAQDAINAAVAENKKGLKSSTPERGVRVVKYPSGLGYVATATAAYSPMENPVATRIAQRKAYVIAFMRAKKSLAEYLGGTSNESLDVFREVVANANSAKEQETGTSTMSLETIKQEAQKMLRGFVVYEVKDDREGRTVYVSIATTPKTQGRASRPAPNIVAAESLRDGLNQVIEEVRANVTFPMGGRIVTMRSTGETAFVGFGSSVVRSSTNSALQAKLNLTALKVAEMRAKKELCAMIRGDWVSGKENSMEGQDEDLRDFATISTDDPLAAGDPTAAKKLGEAREGFLAKLGVDEMVQSATKGYLPPGIQPKSWCDEDHTWAYSIAVYVPSMTNAAAKSSREMDESQIVQPITDGSSKPTGVTPPRESEKVGSGFRDQKNPNIPRPGKEVKPGPSGKIGPE